MRHFHSFTRPAVTVSAISLLALAAGCSRPADTGAASPAAAGAQIGASPSARTASKLGDLSAFRAIAADVAGIIDKGDLPAAKARIKDLEVAWDSAEAGLKPRAADDWHVLDKAIDNTLKALRADAPSQTDCRGAISALLKTFDLLQGSG